MEARSSEVNDDYWMTRVEDVEYDGEVRSLEIRWRNGCKVIAKVDEKGEIDNAVALNRKGRRDLRLQRDVRGSLEELPRRLGWA